MVSLRRLRAVLMLALVSAVGWGVVGTVIALGFQIALGVPIDRLLVSMWEPFGVFASFGLVAGAIYSVAIAMLPQREGQTRLSAVRAGLMGLFGGLAVFFGFFGIEAAMMGEQVMSPTLMVGGAVFGLIGGATGVAIQRVARRGALSATDDSPEVLKP